MLRKGIAFVLIIVNFIGMTGVAFASEEKIGYVTATGLYVRKGPSTTADALRCADHGEKLIILGEEGDWYYVKYNDSVSGYVAKAYVSVDAGAASSSSSKSSGASETLPSKVSELGGAPAASRMGDRGDDVKKLQQALKIMGYYSGSCDGVFGEQTETAVKKLQKAHGMSQDGIAGKVTIRTIFGEEPRSSVYTSDSGSDSSSGKSPEIIGWFNGGKELIPRGAKFTIKDVRTGNTFQVQRLHGQNHLDAEPLTTDDTAVMKKVFGGEWTWNRRPILISYNGRIIAASMNGMPHGDYNITDNGFQGQFCIHFRDSMTHGSLQVDPDHQACVDEAARARW